MNSIAKIILRLGELISSREYSEIESDVLEIKDNSSNKSDWEEVSKTICAFLNTGSGTLIIGIREYKNDKYILTGYRAEQEDKLKTLKTAFTDHLGNILNLEHNIIYRIDETLEKPLLLIYVNELDEKDKYAYYKKKAYERNLTGDHKISLEKIKRHEEYKKELEYAREIEPILSATIENLNLDKLNEYIQRLNREIKVESLKASFEDAHSFIVRKHFVRDQTPTLLGMLVCGDSLEYHVESRCQVDCYVVSSVDIADSKQILKENILSLMERSIAFILRNTQVGITSEQAGSSKFEYPEKLIRESVNNALAHRDYKQNKYVSIRIFPSQHIQIRNPGHFRSTLLVEAINNAIPIRRIIPGNPKPQNPKLAEVLKVFDKWEGQGYGMATLTNACLSGTIDLPYYIFHSEEELSLFIPKGKLLDDKIEARLETFSGYIQRQLNGREMTDNEKTVLAYFLKSEEANFSGRYTISLTQDNNHLETITSLERSGLLVKHEISDRLNTIYIVDRTLMQRDFHNQLRSIFGGEYDLLKKDYKEVLEQIYKQNEFSMESHPSAARLGDAIWIQRGNANKLEGYEGFRRKVRNMVVQLTKKGFIERINDKPNYQINKSFKRTPSIFDQP